MLINPENLTVKGEYFVELVQEKIREGQTRKSAYYEVVEKLEAAGYGFPYKSFESFRNRMYK